MTNSFLYDEVRDRHEIKFLRVPSLHLSNMSQTNTASAVFISICPKGRTIRQLYLRICFAQLDALFKKNSLTALRQALKNATTMNSNFPMRNSAMMKTTKTKYAAGLPAALYTISILFSDQQRSHILHFLQLVHLDFDAFVYSDGLVCRAALFLPYACLVVADILVLLVHKAGRCCRGS